MTRTKHPNEETARKVKELAVAGHNRKEIARIAGVGYSTLHRKYRAELDAGGRVPRGQPRHEPTEHTRKQVASMVAMGMIQPDICRVMGFSIETLVRHYRGEIESSAPLANQQVARRLFEIATKGDAKEAVRACEFWLKCRAGWKTSLALDHTVSEGVPDRSARDELAAIVERVRGVNVARAPGINGDPRMN